MSEPHQYSGLKDENARQEFALVETIEMNGEIVWYRPAGRSGQALLLLVLCGLAMSFSTGCGSSKSLPTTIAFAQGQMAPPSSAVANSTVQFAAVVDNDPANLGVSWLLTCASSTAADCGSITRHTASGVAATYIAPASVPPGGMVTIQANASAIPAASVTTTITITPVVYGPVSIAFSPPLPATVSIGTDPAIVAVVTNDHLGPTGQPLGCTMTPPVCAVSGTCGYLTTLNSCVAAYIPPPQIPQGGTVTFTATSNADPTQVATATVTIVPPTISISFLQTPPVSISAGASANVSATVKPGFAAGNPAVSWSVACSGGSGSACGSFIPQQTANQVITSYKAPSTVPAGGTVTITATSIADPTQQASATVTVNSATLNNNVLNGQYAFLLTGVNVEGTSAVAGSIIADGNGNISAAEESLPGQISLVDGIEGSYFIGADGRGTMTLNGLPGFGSGGWFNGQQTFALTVVDSTHVFMEEFDGTGLYNTASNPVVSPWFGASTRGMLERQQTSDFNVPPSGPYVFGWTQDGGAASGPPNAAYYGGVLNADASGNITDFWMDRYLDGATGSIVSGSYGPQSFGGLDGFGGGTVNVGPYDFNYFLIDSGHMIVLGTSSSDLSGLPAGYMYSQSSGSTPAAGTYLFTLAGSTPIPSANGLTVVGSSALALGGWITSDSSGNLNGYLDSNNNGLIESAQVSGTLTPSVVDGNPISGRWSLTLNGGGASRFAVYPTASHGLLLFELDTLKSGLGTVFLQTSSQPAFQGTYAASIQQQGIVNSARNQSTVGLSAGAWSDISGQIVASASSTITGTLDLDQVNGLFLGPSGNFWTQTPALSATGNFTTGPQGRFTGSITTTQLGLPVITEGVFYVVDDSTVLFLEDDAIPAVGILELQNF